MPGGQSTHGRDAHFARRANSPHHFGIAEINKSAA
jgi:hypothetical protein